MSEPEGPNPLPRRFLLRRIEDETGVSGTGHIADGVVFPDGTAVLRWRTGTASTAVYASTADVETIHGHGGKTRLVFVDLPEGAHPTADWSSSWAELTGYVGQAADDDTTLNPADLLAYLAELKHRALAPVAEWMRALAVQA